MPAKNAGQIHREILEKKLAAEALGMNQQGSNSVNFSTRPPGPPNTQRFVNRHRHQRLVAGTCGGF